MRRFQWGDVCTEGHAQDKAHLLPSAHCLPARNEMTDPIAAEIRATRERIAEELGCDIHAIAEAARKRQQVSGVRTVTRARLSQDAWQIRPPAPQFLDLALGAKRKATTPMPAWSLRDPGLRACAASSPLRGLRLGRQELERLRHLEVRRGVARVDLAARDLQLLDGRARAEVELRQRHPESARRGDRVEQ
jgi:hypothetical protein